MPFFRSSAGATAGDMKPWPATTAPAGWLKCNGAAVSRTLYAALFNVIGTTYGAGDGSTTFNLPDLRGEFVRGLDDGRGVDSGRALGTAQADAFASHTHQGPTYGYGNGTTNWGTGGGTYQATATTTAAGGTETRPRNQALLWIIKF